MTDSDEAEGVVYVNPYKRGSTIFHTDPECHRLKEDHRERDRELMEAWEYRECKHCEGFEPATHDNSPYRSLIDAAEGD